MRRTIMATLPASIVPAVISLLQVALTTRLLSPAELGRYTLTFSLVMAAQTILFFAPTLATIRFHAAAEAEAGTAGFLAGAYRVFCILAAASCLPAMLAGLVAPSWTISLGAALLVLRGLVGQNQAVARARRRMGRYSAVECVHAVFGLAFGLLLLAAGLRGSVALLGGLAGAALVCAAVDVRVPLAALRAQTDPAALRCIAVFAWPLACAYAVTCCLTYADRLLVGGLAGPAALGVYGVAYSLVDRPVTLLCTSVTTGTFPLAVDAYVKHGPEAGRIQAGRNGAVLIGLALPAAVGLCFCAPAIAAVLTGPRFREGVAGLIPVMAAAAFLRGLCAHYIDHAFHLAGRSRAMFAVYAPWAVVAVAMSTVLVPRFGASAAAWSAVFCQAGAAVTGWVVALRVLPLWLPGAALAKIAGCTMAMAGVLAVLDFLPNDVSGLALRLVAGASTYGLVGWCCGLTGKQGSSPFLKKKTEKLLSFAAAASRRAREVPTGCSPPTP